MKITHRQLRRIIKEEIESMLDAEHPSEVEPVEDVWGGDIEGEGKNMELPIDHPEVIGGDDTVAHVEMLPGQGPVPQEEGRVRITKGHLRSIIKRYGRG